MPATVNRNSNRAFGVTILAALVAATGSASTAKAEPAYAVEWIRQMGASGSDIARGVSADGLGNVYIAGDAEGILPGPNAGEGGAFVSKYDAAGALEWTRQPRMSQFDNSWGVSADGLGNVYISGDTVGASGDSDAFVSKYDASGGLQWTRQFGTNESEQGLGIAADGLGNVYITGDTYGSLGGPNADDGTEPYPSDAFVSKYDAAGELQWTQQWGTPNQDWSHGVSADGLGNVYIAGSTGTFGGPIPPIADFDAFLNKYDASGALQWTRQLGTNVSDFASGVTADGLGNVYIAGSTAGSLGGSNTGGYDAFVSKYDASGDLQWTRQGPRLMEFGIGGSWPRVAASADGLGNVYLTSQIEGALGGPNAADALVSKYNASGDLLWSQQLGTDAEDFGLAVSADGLGNVYLSGGTLGSLGGPNAGEVDAFLARLTAVPEPSSLALLALALPLYCRRWR